MRFIKELVPLPIKRTIRRIERKVLTWGELVPPDEMIFVGGGDFKAVGEHFLQIFVEHCGLKQDENVLDVGCGIGRMAIPLTKYLTGRYEGFDIVPEGIRWCEQKISHKYSNFHFRLADVYNSEYNKEGQYKASEYRFSYGSEEFDFVFATSVFTHLLPQDTENYLSEIARVLKKGERCLITYFLLNLESLKQIHAKISKEDFRYGTGRYRTTDKNTPEAAVAYEEEYIRELYRKFGLQIVEPIHYGHWCGREESLSYQDIVIATKR
jgi:ubiquinone/menaquinone biosynthesis C-methylase UbiE